MDSATPTVLLVGPADATSSLRGRIDASSIEVVGTTDAPGLDDALISGAVDVLVVVPGADELAATGPVLRRCPGTRALVVSDGAADPAVLIEAGIGGVVPSSADDDHLTGAILGLARGEGYLDAALARHVIDAHAASGADLSATEAEVLSRLADGETADAIADDYAVTPRLVRLHAGGPLARLLPV